MRAALEALNRLLADRVIEDYAIGGAIGASFYLPAMQTEDLDVFVFLPPAVGPLVTLTPVYDALKARGGQVEGEHIRFGKWPVQILTDANALIAEAIREAVDTDYDGSQLGCSRRSICARLPSQQGGARTMLALCCSSMKKKWTLSGFRRSPRASASQIG